MTFLNLDSSVMSSTAIVGRIQQAQQTLLSSSSSSSNSKNNTIGKNTTTTRKTITGLGLENIEMDENILQSLLDFLRQVIRQQQQQSTNRTVTGLTKLSIHNCVSNPFLDYFMEAVLALDIFTEIELQGSDNNNIEPIETNGAIALADNDEDGDNHVVDDEEQVEDTIVPRAASMISLEGFGFKIRFSKVLQKLEFIDLIISRDDIESIMYGIETTITNTINSTVEENESETGSENNIGYCGGCHLQMLSFEGVTFVNDSTDGTSGNNMDTIQELCDGMQNNSTLQTLELQRCQLTDTQIAILVQSLINQPTLHTLNISENHSCRQVSLQSLNQLLSLTTNNEIINNQEEDDDDDFKTNRPCRRHCQLQSLDLSYQFTAEESFATGERMQLELLLLHPQAQTQPQSQCNYYPYLQKLNLSGNQIQDSDMQYIAMLLLIRFPILEELDLRFNDITDKGLQLLVDHSQQIQKNDISTNKPIISRIRTIRLTNNPITNECSKYILELFKLYLELQFIQSNIRWENSIHAQDIQHLQDINRAGRVLLVRRLTATPAAPSSPQQQQQQQQQEYSDLQRRSIALSVWPYVLERVTRKGRYHQYIPAENRVNGMYYLLRHGPIFMEKIMIETTASGNQKKDRQYWYQQNKKQKGDPALGGYTSLAEFLRCEAGVTA